MRKIEEIKRLRKGGKIEEIEEIREVGNIREWDR